MGNNTTAKRIVRAVYDGFTEAQIANYPAGCMEKAMAAARAALGLRAPQHKDQTNDG